LRTVKVGEGITMNYWISPALLSQRNVIEQRLIALINSFRVTGPPFAAQN
jgi:hypothetical protein